MRLWKLGVLGRNDVPYLLLDPFEVLTHEGVDVLLDPFRGHPLQNRFLLTVIHLGEEVFHFLLDVL